MSLILMTVHPERPEAQRLASSTLDRLLAAGHVVRLPREDAAHLGRSDLALGESDVVGEAVLAVSVGGDGTMLRTFALVARAQVPVLGVNAGSLGYLAAVEPEGVDSAITAVLAGDGRIERRMTIELHTERAGGRIEGPWMAVNEGVVEKKMAGHTVHLGVAFNGRRFTTYSADGLIVATPTGSTAYSLSARGPIVEPRHRAILFTPVSPHTLFDRSLVLDPDTEVRIWVAGDREAILAVDGRQVCALSEGDTVIARRSATDALLVTSTEDHFHQILRAKFGLGGP